MERESRDVTPVPSEVATTRSSGQSEFAPEREARRDRYPRPSRGEWIKLAILALALVLGIVAVWQGKNLKKDIPFVALAFSFFVLFALRPLRLLRYRQTKFMKVEVLGGVPIRGPRWHFLVFAAWGMILGAICSWFGWEGDSRLLVVGTTMLLLGGYTAMIVYLRYLPLGHVQFEPDVLIISEWRWRARIPWNQITFVKEKEVNEFPYLLLFVDGPVDVEPKLYQSQWHRFGGLSRQFDFDGSQFAISAFHLGIDLPVLTAAVVRYRADKAAREELKLRRGLPAR